MEEMKLTDEEIVKELINESNRGEWCELNFIDCVEVRVLKNALDLINRQKAEIERLTSLYDCKTAFMTSSIGDLPLTVEGLRKAVDEISRLLIVQTELQELNAKYYNQAKDLRRENAELQKQVDALLNRRIEPKIFQCHADALENFPKVEQAVKDTAKEILQDLYYEFDRIGDEGSCGEIRLMAERYGVEVE